MSLVHSFHYSHTVEGIFLMWIHIIIHMDATPSHSIFPSPPPPSLCFISIRILFLIMLIRLKYLWIMHVMKLLETLNASVTITVMWVFMHVHVCVPLCLCLCACLCPCHWRQMLGTYSRLGLAGCVILVLLRTAWIYNHPHSYPSISRNRGMVISLTFPTSLLISRLSYMIYPSFPSSFM